MYVGEAAPARGARVRRTQRDRRRATRAALIEATIGILSTLGFAGTTTALIARRAGVTTGALHHHFATKDALLFAVLDHVSSRVQLRLAQSERHAPGGRPRTLDLLRELWAVYGQPEYWAVWEIIIGTRADAQLHRRIVAHREATMRKVVHPWLARHAIGGTRRDAIAIFELMLIAIRGLGLERFLDKEDGYLGRNLALLAELVERRLAAAPARASAPPRPNRGGPRVRAQARLARSPTEQSA